MCEEGGVSVCCYCPVLTPVILFWMFIISIPLIPPFSPPEEVVQRGVLLATPPPCPSSSPPWNGCSSGPSDSWCGATWDPCCGAR
jgi:hypothetical protein